MQFLTPLAFLGGLIAIPIILLYMLRLRRRDVAVSSIMLWQQVVRDTEANTPWQKLRRNLLLFLQLLILALLVFALARPFLIVPSLGGGRVALLLDASASMTATDGANGDTRFEDARRLANQLVDELSVGSVMSVIRVGATAEILSPYTSDRARLHSAIDSTAASLGTADWNAALTLAAAGGGGAADFDVLIVSDGGGVLSASAQAVAALPSIPGDLRYIPVGNAAGNLAVTALAVAALPGQAPELFTQIENMGTQTAEVVITVFADGALIVTQNQTIAAGEAIPFGTDDLPADFTTVRVGWTPASGSTYVDHLAVDDTAWAINTTRDGRSVLLMTEGNLFLDQGLRSLLGSSVSTRAPEEGLTASPNDLTVFDGWVPPTLPAGDLLFINPPEATSLFAVGADSTQTQNPTVQRDDPRMAFVDFSTVNILKFRQVTASWAQPLIAAEGGALLLVGETDGRQVAILTFDLRDSDLPLQIQYPILLSALLEWFTPQGLVDAPDGVRVNDPVLVTPGVGADSVRITLPDGTARSLALTGQALPFTETYTPGIYTIETFTNGAVAQTAAFAVNLFAPQESAIASAETITIGGAVIPQALEEEAGQREYWDILALAALLILLIEWFAYHRRLRPPTLGARFIRRVARSS